MRESYRELQSTEQMEEFLYDKRIIVYGAGIYGQCLVDYMCNIGRRDRIDSIVVTNTNSSSKKNYAGFAIQKAQERFENLHNEWIVIAVSIVHREALCELADQYTSNYICISDKLHFQMNGKIDRKALLPIRKIDFCVAGFAKCGTSSLSGVLSGLDNIFLPQCKETLFFEWYKKMDDPEKFLETKYFDGVRKEQVVGMIEPSFSSHAKEVRQLLGNEVKIIFLLRNPIDALFSYFKMSTRSGSNDELGWLYQKSDFSDEMYTEYLRRRISMHALTVANYSFWIGQYLEQFPNKQIKILFFEELVKNPQQEINSILDYIGCYDSCRSCVLPHINSGDFVMADKEGYILAVQRRKLIMKLHSNAGYTNEDREKLKKVEKEYQQARKIYNIKMTPEQKMLSKDFFDKDVKWLENLTERNLAELWNW